MLCRNALHADPPPVKMHPEADSEEPRWYAVYTWARHEKAVASQFEQRGLKHFLPLYLTVRHSNMRTVRLSLPLFPSYVFVQTGAAEHFRPLQVPGVVHYVGNRRASPIPNDEIEGLRRVLLSGVGVAPHPYLAPGNAVWISSGPLAGLSGVIERTKSGSRFIVSVNMIMRSIAVEVNGLHLTADPPPARAGLSVA
jgi:transcriptional antiterminator NusG